MRTVLAPPALVLTALLLAACTPTATPDPAAGPTAATSADATETTAAPALPLAPGADRARELLGLVRNVATRPDVAGYDRDCGPGDGCVFGTDWSDDTDAPDGRDGCDTRNDVLAAQLDDVVFSERSPGCDVVGGTLRDPYTDAVVDYATAGSDIHVDHLFPLAAAWDLGAASWPLERRTRFANDTSLELVAVGETVNLQKGDSTPASWLPPARGFRCTYVTAYPEVALAYDLAVTEADVRVIEPVPRKNC